MFTKYFTVGLVLLGAVSARKAHVFNGCKKTVYLWSVDTEQNPSSPTPLAPGESYSEAYRKPAIGGVSIKLSFENVLKDPITQFEYTDGGEMDGFIWYDVSNVNCQGSNCPFQPYGFSFGSAPGCPSVTCAPGVDLCDNVYNVWNDDHASLACDGAQDIHLSLCLGESSPGGGQTPKPSKSKGTSVSTSTSTADYNVAPTSTLIPTTLSSYVAAASDVTAASESDSEDAVKSPKKNVVVVTVTQVSTVRHYADPTPPAHRRHRRHSFA